MRIDRKQAGAGPLFLQATIDDSAIDEETRTVNFLASDESIDRYGDIVKADWNLGPYKKNPVFLWNHDYSLPPIGTVKAGVDGKRLMTRATFTEEGLNPFADQLYKLVKAKVLRAVSVGFHVDSADVELIRDAEDKWTGGYKYNNPELLELSLCNVGANAHALAVARSLGVSPANVARMLVPDALVEQQRTKIFAAIVGARVRALKNPSPR